MNTIARFLQPEDAHLFRGHLGSPGIESFVYDEFTVQNTWTYSQAIGGVRVVVDPSDAPAASQIYHGYVRDVLSHHDQLQPARAWPLALLISLLAGLPVLMLGRRRCPASPVTDPES